ncbi:MAG: DUF721 domain-containing protein [Atopobiaceae bacterium]|nr:DUF721 domain-containing protein [Atopobiaceae bacterium]
MAVVDGANRGVARAGDLVGALFGAAGTSKLSDAQRAARAWFQANGDRERAHTTGVWLRKSGRAGVDPIMVVRLDSGLLAQELGTNKDLYLARIARAGIAVSDIRFDVGRPPSTSRPKAPTTATRVPSKPRELSALELERVRELTSELPDGLRQSVSRAMCATLARRKLEDT